MDEDIIERLKADARWEGLDIVAELDACNRWHKRKGVPVRWPESVERWLLKAKTMPVGRTIDLDKLLSAKPQVVVRDMTVADEGLGKQIAQSLKEWRTSGK